MSRACFCTLAIHSAYRRRARVLCADAAPAPWIVRTDEPDDLADLPMRVIRHTPTEPIAIDYLASSHPSRRDAGPAYHDRRFVVAAALQDFDTAIDVDADSRLGRAGPLGAFPPGLSILPLIRRSIARPLAKFGRSRLPCSRRWRGSSPATPACSSGRSSSPLVGDHSRLMALTGSRRVAARAGI